MMRSSASEDKLIVIVTILLSVVTFVYLYVKYKINYWKRRNVEFIAPSFPFGNLGDVITQKCSMGVQLQKLYEISSGPFVGIFAILRPMLLIRDPELCHNIMVKDFSYFHDRGIHCNENYDPLSGHLFHLIGDKWKNLRAKLTPTFTSGKLKMMFQTLVDCGDILKEYLLKVADKEESIEMQDVVARYTTDIIASVAFGIEVDSINNSDLPFRVIGKEFFKPTFKNGLKMFLTFFSPTIMHSIRLKLVPDHIEKFFISVVKETMEYREKNNVQRKDFMQLLIQLRNTGTVDYGNDWNVNVRETKSFSLNELAAQAFVFYVAGFETSSTTMAFCLYEIAKNPEIQQKVQKEIDEVLVKHDQILTYDSITEMKYLEMCIDETLRKYPALPFIIRECTRDYKIPGSDVIIEKGTVVFLPSLGLQRDTKYYSNPHDFIPERFSAEFKDTKRPYMPFGDGPRMCIGLRLGKMQTKVGMVSMLSKFNFSLSENEDCKKLQMDPQSLILRPVGGFHFKIYHRK